jgi:hypothetical protein
MPAPAQRGITAMSGRDIEPSRPPRGEPGCPPRGMACAGHVFAAHVRADPGLVWTALTDPGQTAAYLYGLAANSSWVSGDPIEFRVGGRARRSARSCTPAARNGCPTCCKPGQVTRPCT